MQSTIEHLFSTEASTRIEALQKLHELLKLNDDALSHAEAQRLLAYIPGGIGHNNVKICLPTIALIQYFAPWLESNLAVSARASAMSTILDSLAERLGDAKPLIRNAALNAVEAIQTVITPRRTVLLLKGGLTHKNFRVRESVLQVIVGYEESQHDQELLTTILSQVVPLLDDSNSAVREQASKYLQICYRTDRSLRNSIINLATRASHTSYLLSKFDEIDASMFKVDPEAQRLAPEVKPIFVSTEAELRHHMSGVDKIMSKEGSWEEKVSGMLLLTAILLGGATKVKGFGAMLKVLEESIHSQIREMRSSVIKEACSLVSLLSKQMGSGFSSYADVYIPTLLKQTCVTIQIISDSCDYCIQTILRNTPVGSNIMSLLTSSAATASHKVIRQKCTIYIRQLLEDRTLHYLDKYIDSIEHTINKTVYDADGQVRMTARRCFSAFASRWPERRDKLFYGFEASIQNTITKEEANPAALEPPAPRKGSSTPTRERSTAASAKASGAQRVPSALVAPIAAPPPKAYGAGRVATNTAIAAPPTPTSSAVGPLRVPVEKSTKPEPKLVREESLSGPQRVLASSDEKKFAPASVKKATKVPVPAGLATPGSHSLSKPERVPAEAKDILVHKKSAPAMNSQASSLGAPAVNKSRSATGLSSSDKLAKSASHSDIPTEDNHFLNQILTQAEKAADWSERAKAIAALRSKINDDKFRTFVFNSPSRLDRLTLVVGSRLLDPHFKVQNNTVEFLNDLMCSWSDKLKTCLDKLLSSILIVAFGSTKIRDDTKQLASSLIEIIETQYPVSHLMHTALKTLEQTDSKIKLGVVKFLIKLLNSSVGSSHISSGAQMAILIQRLAKFGKWDSCAELRFATVELLTLASSQHQSVFDVAFATAAFQNKEELNKKLRVKAAAPIVFPATEVGQPSASGTRIIPASTALSASATTSDAAARRARLVRSKSVGKIMKPEPTADEGADVVEAASKPLAPVTPLRRTRSIHSLDDQSVESIAASTENSSKPNRTPSTLRKRKPLAPLDSNITKETIQSISAALKPSKSELKSSELHAEAIVSLLNFHQATADTVQVDNTPEFTISTEAPMAISEPVPVDYKIKVDELLEQGCSRLTMSSLSSLLSTIPDDSLRCILDATTLISFLDGAINSDDAQVRKGAVFCLVDLRLTLGNDSAKVMDNLTESHKKLVNLYFQRREPQATVASRPVAV